MNWWNPEQFLRKRPYLEKRVEVIRSVRKFFDERGYLEVQTPAMQVMPAADAHIHAFELDNGLYLHTSPEFEMKKLLVAGCERIYQICPVYRKEVVSSRHAEEFTMIEWYNVGANYVDLMNETEDLLKGILAFQTAERMSVCEMFERYCGIDLGALLEDRDGFAAAAQDLGLEIREQDMWDDIFHIIMDAKIEGQLGQGGVPTFVYDYPISMASLSRKKVEDPRFSERFEVYVNGIELANAFGELTDAAEQRRRFEESMKLKQELYGHRFPLDEDFLAALEHGMPECSGIALGIDRLVMLAAGAGDIKDVIWSG